MIYVNDRVRVCAHWSSFVGMSGVVTSTSPLMVRLDGDAHPMRFGEREVVREGGEPSSISMTGAE